MGRGGSVSLYNHSSLNVVSCAYTPAQIQLFALCVNLVLAKLQKITLLHLSSTSWQHETAKFLTNKHCLTVAQYFGNTNIIMQF